MPNTKDGVKMLYPTYTGTNAPKPWFIENGFENGDRIRLDEDVSGNTTDGFRLDDNSKVRFTVSADSKDVDIECDNDFAESTKRGYVYKPNDWMGVANTGVEMTAYFWCSEVDQSDNTVKGNPLSMKGPTGEHHSNTDCCSGSAHMLHIGGEGEDLDKRIATRLSKEMWHVNYFPRGEYKIIPNETWALTDSKWFGVKYVIYKTTVNNVKSTAIEVYLNSNADKQSWKKITHSSTIDSGGWGSDGDECNGKNDDPLAFGNARMMFRWDYRDGADVKFKWVSIRPIDPRADFDEDPTNPPTNTPTVTTFRSRLKLQRDINSSPSACGLGGLNIIYQIVGTANAIERKLVNHVDQDYRTRAVQRCNPSGGSSIQGHTPHEALFEIRRNGTGTGTIRAKIWDSAGNQKYQSVNTINVTALSTTFDGVFDSFDMSTNTYQMQNGDRIGVEYTASSDVDDCVVIRAKDPGDGSTGTFYESYNNNTGTWSKVETRDLFCQILE